MIDEILMCAGCLLLGPLVTGWLWHLADFSDDFQRDMRPVLGYVGSLLLLAGVAIRSQP